MSNRDWVIGVKEGGLQDAPFLLLPSPLFLTTLQIEMLGQNQALRLQTVRRFHRSYLAQCPHFKIGKLRLPVSQVIDEILGPAGSFPTLISGAQMPLLL